MGQINKIPLGFLNMLGSQTGGKNPFFAAEQVNPTVDMVPFYHAQGLSVETAPLVGPGVTVLDFAELEVPENEAWFVYTVSVQTAFTNALCIAQFNFSLFSTPAGLPNNSMVIGASGDIQGAGTIIVPSAAVQFPSPLPIVAGSKLRCTLSDVSSAANQSFLFSALVAKFSA